MALDAPGTTEMMRRVWKQNAGVWLGIVGLFCLFEVVELGWHIRLGFQQHLRPNDLITWASRPRGGYSVTQYTFSALIWSALGYLAVGVTALLTLARRHGFRLGRVPTPSVKPRSERRR